MSGQASGGSTAGGTAAERAVATGGAATWSAAGIGAAGGLVPAALASFASSSPWLADARLAAGAAFACMGAAGGVWLSILSDRRKKAPLFAAAGFLPPAAVAAISLLALPPDGARHLAADLALYPAVFGAALSMCSDDPRPCRVLRSAWRGLFLAAAAVGISLPPALLAEAVLRAARPLVEWMVIPAAFGLGNAVFLLSLWRHRRREESKAALGRLLERLRSVRKESGKPKGHLG